MFILHADGIVYYSLRPTQDGHILEWHEILGTVVGWNKVEKKNVVEYFDEKRGETRLFSKLESCHLN